jgi:hypothetical protein
MAYRLARFHVGRNPRRRKLYVAYRTAAAVAVVSMILLAFVGTAGVIAAAAVLRFWFTLTH